MRVTISLCLILAGYRQTSNISCKMTTSSAAIGENFVKWRRSRFSVWMGIDKLCPYLPGSFQHHSIFRGISLAISNDVIRWIVFGMERYMEKTCINIVSTVSAAGLAPVGSRASAGAAMTKIAWINAKHIMMTSPNGIIFPATGPLCPVNSPHKGQWRGALIFSFICPWINSWVSNREAGDLRRHRAHYDVTAKTQIQDGVPKVLADAVLRMPFYRRCTITRRDSPPNSL